MSNEVFTSDNLLQYNLGLTRNNQKRSPNLGYYQKCPIIIKSTDASVGVQFGTGTGNCDL